MRPEPGDIYKWRGSYYFLYEEREMSVSYSDICFFNAFRLDGWIDTLIGIGPEWEKQ